MMHTFTVYVEDRPGVLNRVSSLFRRRNFNIISLAVGHSETPGVSRMTVVVQTDPGGAQRIQAHLYKLIHVISVEDITNRPAVIRDLALIKVCGRPREPAGDHAAGRSLRRPRRRRGAGIGGARDGGIGSED